MERTLNNYKQSSVAGEFILNYANSTPILSVATSPLRIVVGLVQLAINAVFGLVAEMGLCHHERFGNKESHDLWKDRTVMAGGLAITGLANVAFGVLETLLAISTLGIGNYYIFRNGWETPHFTEIGVGLAEGLMKKRLPPVFSQATSGSL
jgi:hypothetical protein